MSSIFGGGGAPTTFAGVPSGACSTTQTAVDTTSGHYYACNGGAWILVGPGAAGSAAFNTITTGTNTSATMTVGSGSTLNTAAGSSVDFSATGPTSFKLPVAAGAAPLADGTIGVDSTTHVLNFGSNSSTVAVASFAGDIAGNTALSPQVKSTHLTAALPVAQGGTAVTDFSFSGSTHKAATASGTLTSNTVIKFDASGNVITSGLTDNGTTVSTTESVDFSAAAHTQPALKGTTAGKPATCTQGEIYFATDATAGQNLFFCSATNTWTQQLNSGGGGGGSPGGSGTEIQFRGGVSTFSAVTGSSSSGGNVQLQANSTFIADGFQSITSSPQGGVTLPGFNAKRTNSTTLTFNAEASTNAPAIRCFRYKCYAFTSSFAPVVSGGQSITAFFYIRASDGAFICGHNGLTMTCPGGSLVTSITAFPTDGSIPLWSWTTNTAAGQWDANGGTAWNGLQTNAPISGSTGIISTNNSSGSASIAIDTAVVPQLGATNVWTGLEDYTEQAAPANPSSGNQRIYADSTSHVLKCLTSSGGNCLPSGGTVTSFSAGTLSPLFTTSVATATTTPALTFSLSNAGGGTLFGNNTGSSAAPTFTTAPVLGVAGTSTGSIGFTGATSGTVTVTAQATAGSPTLTLPNATGTFAVTASAPLSLSATTGALSITGAAGQVLAGSGPAFTLTPTLGVAGASTGTLSLTGVTSGTVVLTPQSVAGSPTLTFPNTTGTFAVGASSPLSLSATTGNLTCATCATTTNGGALSGTLPISVSAGGAISVATATSSALGAVIPRDNLTVDGSGNTDWIPGDPNVAYWFDDFGTAAMSASNNIGALGWTVTSISSSPTMSAQASVYPHIGIVRLATAATSANGGTLGFNNVTTVGDLADNTNWTETWIFRLNQTTNTLFKIGFAGVNNNQTPVDGIWLRYDTTQGDATFVYETRKASTSTTSNGPAIDTNWHKIVIASTTAGQIVFTLDANSPVTLSSNVPTASVIPLFILTTQTTSAATVDVDMFSLKFRGLGR